MNPPVRINHQFVDAIPTDLKVGTLYISIEYATAVHKCLCGCGNEVVTPLSPTDWKLVFDGETVSLDPSIGNWSLECKSHYWIEGKVAKWAPGWSTGGIEEGRARDRRAKKQYFEDKQRASSTNIAGMTDAAPGRVKKP